MNGGFAPKFKRFAFVVQGIFLVFLLSLLVIIIQINSIQSDIKRAQANAQHSIALAYDLFQSSENLTSMARSYVATGNPMYKKAFRSVLDVRDGKIPRQSDYSPVYWHLKIDNNAQTRSKNQYSGMSLRSLMVEAEFIEEELKLLDSSREISDRLALIEQEAFRIIDNLLINGEGFEYGDPQATAALRLLYDDAYREIKRDIMSPIEKVISSVEQRTSLRTNSLQSEIQWYIYYLWGLVAIGFLLSIFVFNHTLVRFVTPLYKLSHNDALTKTLNRRGFIYLAEREFKSSQRTNIPFSLIMIDIDYFKKVNDTYGHAVGDEVLKLLSQRIRADLRATDILSRWGGEEFLVLLPGLESGEAFNKAEKIRRVIENSHIQVNTELTLPITVSIGVSTYNTQSENLDSIIHLADMQLYRAKEFGRNKVYVSP